MLTPDQVAPQTFPGRPGVESALVPMVKHTGLPVRVTITQRRSRGVPGRWRHGLCIHYTDGNQHAIAPLAEWRWEAN